MTYDQYAPLREAEYRREFEAKILSAKLARDDDNSSRLDRYTRHRDEWVGR